MNGRVLSALALSVAVLTLSLPARAWLLHEHAAIAHEGYRRLDAAEQQALEQAWAGMAKTNSRYCSKFDIGLRLFTVAGSSYCVGFSTLTGVAADHSCHPDDTNATVKSSFLIDVLMEAEGVSLDLKNLTVKGEAAKRVVAWKQHHIAMQRADPNYLTRAEGNGAHFQIPRIPGETLEQHVARVTQQGAVLSGIAIYLHYHALALHHAARAKRGQDRAQSERAFGAEAMALHFLEDAFSAGHQVRPVGTKSERMGTHDYYCEHGIDATRWNGQKEYVAHGDGFLTEEDLAHASEAVQASLSQLAAAFAEERTPEGLDASNLSYDFDICKGLEVEGALARVASNPTLLEPVRMAPKPAMAGPRRPVFSQELGVFYMPSAELALRADFEDFSGDTPDGTLGDFERIPGRLQFALGLGLTLDGITAGSTDGLVVLSIPLIVDGRPPGTDSGMRIGSGFMWHLPFYAVPFDLIPAALILGPIDAFAGTNLLMETALGAVAGGWPGRLQRKIPVWNGHFQFILGREGTLAVMKRENPDAPPKIFSFRGSPGYMQVQLPVFSFTGLHSSRGDIAFDVVWQLGYDFTWYTRDDPYGPEQGNTFHGVFLSAGYRSRRYFWDP